MKKFVKLYALAICCIFVLTACALVPATQPPLTPTPAVPLADRLKVYKGGYSFQPPSGFETNIDDYTGATITRKDDTILLGLVIVPRKTEADTVETMLVDMLAIVPKDTKDFKSDKPYAISVGKINGMAVNFSQISSGKLRVGQLIVLDRGKVGFFITGGYVDDEKADKRWEAEVRPFFDALVGSIEFFEPGSAALTSPCPIATNPDYGYTTMGSIKVGGGDTDGPSREQAYLDNLVGPNGEKLTYENLLLKGDFDGFKVTGLKKPVTLYFSKNLYFESLAPVGFTCLAAFPLTKP